MENSPSSGNPRSSFREIGRTFRDQWPRYLLDVVVIIFSIMASFGLDNVREESARAKSEQLYLADLQNDIQSDIRELHAVIDRTDEVLRYIATLLEMSQAISIDSPQIVSRSIRKIVQRPTFVSKDATFSNLTSSGNMNVISDNRLKNGLFEYYRMYESMRAIEASERELSNNIVAVYLMKTFSLTELAGGSPEHILRDGQLVKVVHDVEFTNIVAIRKINRVELRDVYQDLLELAEAINTKLEALVKK